MKSSSPNLSIAHAASLLGMVRGALALESSGAIALVWPHTPLGPLWAEAKQKAAYGPWQVCRVHWGLPEGYVVQTLHKPQQALWDMLDGYFKGNLPQPSWEHFAPVGTPFQHKVWQALCSIPWGQTLTYGQLAAQVGSHPRAVGGAVGSNPIPVLIPCHRIMGKDGNLTGFSAPGGLTTKTWLLQHEGVLVC
jgi:methylated-DNA-[protein]-cysteine S-methyltransferase